MEKNISKFQNNSKKAYKIQTLTHGFLTQTEKVVIGKTQSLSSGDDFKTKVRVGN